MKVTYEEIVVASYVISLGKIAQRTGLFENKTPDLILTDFIQKHVNNFPATVNIENIKDLLSNYQTKSTSDYKILFLASNLAAGYGYEQSIPETAGIQSKAMRHLLSIIKLPENQEPNTAYYKPEILNKNDDKPNEAIIASNVNVISKEQYENLWNAFDKDFLKFKQLSLEEFVHAFDSLLENYFWSIPLLSGERMDVGVYQHSKNTAAIASILYKYEEENTGKIENDEEKKFAFINGDVSGIQKYIFELKENEYSSKLLRAKSFQLWALSEILSQYICKKFGLTSANIITSAGGKFMLMLPNVKNTETLINEIQIEVEKYFLTEFSGKLAVIISDGVYVSQKMLLKENAQNLFNSIGTKADVCKQFKMQKALKYGYKIEEQYDALQKNGECPKCGIFPSSTPDGTGECPNCKALVKIGKNLMHGSYIKLKNDELESFGKMLEITEKAEGFCYSINEYVPGLPVMYLPYVAPRKNNYELKTFEDLSKQSNGKIAMFKSDIDNLGLVFSSSLGNDISISSYADLSHSLHIFFSAYYADFVKHNIDRNKIPYSETIYTVFSGGDDLCLLGSWNSVMHFASDFQKKLCEFTNNNPSVTLSGGISLSAPGNPVANIAADSEELLELSKDYPSIRSENDGPLKNAITVFGTTVSWTDYKNLIDKGIDLQNKLESKNVSVGVVYRFIEYSNMAEQCLAKKDAELISPHLWKSHLSYNIVRNVKDKGIADGLKKLGADANKMVKSRIAVCYALYTQRKIEE